MCFWKENFEKKISLCKVKLRIVSFKSDKSIKKAAFILLRGILQQNHPDHAF